MASRSKLEAFAEKLPLQLTAEIEAVRNEVQGASDRLGKIPPGLLPDGGRLAVHRALAALYKASEQLEVSLQHLHRQRPVDHGER